MHYSSLFTYCFALVINLSLSGAKPAWNKIQSLESDKLLNFDNTVVNIGNGINRKNVIILDESDATPPTYRRQLTQGHKVSSISNIGNGLQNNNTIVTVNGDKSTVISQDSNPNGFNNDGLNFVHTRAGTDDIFNVGYGEGNQNKVIINDKSLESDNTAKQPPASSELENQLRSLYNIADQLEQFITKLIREIQMNEVEQQ